jgi:hypothetical protein
VSPEAPLRTLTVRHGACNKHRMNEPKPPIPSAAVILLRDSAGGIEVLMQRRREQATAFAGVVVFPISTPPPISARPGRSSPRASWRRCASCSRRAPSCWRAAPPMRARRCFRTASGSTGARSSGRRCSPSTACGSPPISWCRGRAG